MSEALDRDTLLSLEDAEIEEVDMDKWWPGKKVFVRSMTVADRDAFEAEGLKREGKGKKTRYVPTLKDTRSRLLVRCLCERFRRAYFWPRGRAPARPQAQRRHGAPNRHRAAHQRDVGQR